MSLNIYESAFVESLFDRMSASYEHVNYITSFGFSERWRRQCVETLQIRDQATVVDLLCGMGECWEYIFRSGRVGNLVGLDFSTEMLKGAASRRSRLYQDQQIALKKENVFANSIPAASADHVISGFGLKTFNPDQLKALAAEIHRILKPGGSFSLIDVSVPTNSSLRLPYMFYLKNIIPILGALFLGNPETYRMLGIYTEKFNNAENLVELFQQQSFEVEYVQYFFGCASGIKGIKTV